MSVLILNLNNGSKWVIDLVDSNFICEWAHTVSNKNMWETEHVALGSQSYDPERFAETLDSLYKGLLEIPNTMGCPVPECFPGTQSYNIDDVKHTQHWMNRIHRWCVYSMLRKPYFVDDQNITAGAIRSLEDPNKMTDSINLLFQLNQNVHAVESTYTSPGVSDFPCTGVYTAPYWDQGFDGDQVGYADRADYEEQLADLFTKDNYDVYIAKRILGKDFRESWLDSDDPGAADVCNVDRCLHYAFEVDPLNDLSSFYKSQEFEKWLKTAGVEPTNSRVGRIPVGNIINLPSVDETRHILTTQKITSMEYIK